MARTAALISLLVLTAWWYSPVMDGPFHYEDQHWLTTLNVPLSWSVPGRTLTAWTYQAQAGVSPDPYWYHAGNLALHLLNGTLVYGIAASIAPSAALVAAGIFLLHPLTSQAVIYVAARPDLLLTTLVLFAAWIMVSAQTWRPWRIVLMLLALCGAALSKELGLIGIPLLLWTVIVFRRDAFRASPVLVMVLWVAFGAICGLAYGPLMNWLTLVPGWGGTSFTWAQFVDHQQVALWQLLSLLIPWDGYTIDHDVLALGPRWTVVASLCSVAVVAALIAWPQRLAIWAVGWLALSVAPRFIFQTNEFLAEHQLYLGLSGLSMALGTGSVWLWHKEWAWRSKSGGSIRNMSRTWVASPT